jgi:hypothetical protein
MGEVAIARGNLKSINSGTPEYAEAQELLKEVAKREKQIELASKLPAVEVRPTPDAAGIDEAEGGEEDESSTSQIRSCSSNRTSRQATLTEYGK